MVGRARFFLLAVPLGGLILTFYALALESSLVRRIDSWAFGTFGIQLFDCYVPMGLKDVHLDGAGLLNQSILVEGKVSVVDSLGAHMILMDERARMLVDVSKLESLAVKALVRQGDMIRVHGKVKTGEKGNYYLVANAIHRG